MYNEKDIIAQWNADMYDLNEILSIMYSSKSSPVTSCPAFATGIRKRPLPQAISKTFLGAQYPEKWFYNSNPIIVWEGTDSHGNFGES